MALHPFHSFRKHQKVIFAGLTIVCMLTFVMSSGIAGMGDGFAFLQNLLTGKSRYPTVATLFRKNIDIREMAALREQRSLANSYMMQAVFVAHDNIIREAEKIVPQLDAQAQTQIGRLLQTRQFAFDPRLAQYGFAQQYTRNVQQFNVELMIAQENLTKAKKTSEADKLGLLRAAIMGDQYLLHVPKDELYPDSNLYFGGSLSNEGLLDFKIWQAEADRLGIYLNSDDIVRAIQDETLGRLTNDDGLMIEKMITPRNQQFKVDLLTALAEEFRVRLAQTTLIGFDPGGIIRVPAPVTPAELWEYYRRNRTELSVKFLPIPVSKFIDQVKDKPTDAELTKLFEEYKNFEFNPQSETPGFKQPRRIKVEWVAAKPDAPRYRKEARKWIMSALAATPGNPWMAMALLDPVLTEYNRMTNRFGDGSLKISPWTEQGFALSYVTYAHWQRAESAAALVGKLAGASVNGNLLGAFMATQAVAHARESKGMEAAIAQEARNRVPGCVSLVTAATAPSPVLTMCGLYQVLEAKEFSLPMEMVKSRLVAKLEEDLARDILTHTITTFRKELEAAKGKAAEADKVIDKFVKEGGWEHGSSTTFDDVYNLAKDPKLAKLKDAYIADHFDDPKAKMFSYQFFSNSTGGQPKLFVAEEMKSRSDDTNYLWWRTADEPAKVLTFEQARPEVEKAWRFQKARELAMAEAERIAKQSPSDPVPALLDAAKKLGATPFEIFGIAHLRPALQSRAPIGGGADFEAFRPPEDKIEFPPIDLVDKLMDPGTKNSVVVLADQPKNIVYVAVVMNRVEPSVKDFQRDTSPLIRQSPMLTALEQERRLGYRIAVMNHLRDNAGLHINEQTVQAMRENRSNLPEDDS
jgi:hypothetical protein